jgi:hypothetical protein
MKIFLFLGIPFIGLLIWLVWQLFNDDVPDTGSKPVSWTPEDQARAEADWDQATYAASACGLIAPVLPEETLEELLHPGIVILHRDS